MKKVLFLAALLMVAFTGMAQTQQSQTSKREQERKVREEKKEERKAVEAVQEQISFEQAMQALKDQSFVLEADNVIFRNGLTTFVTSNTNFLSVNGQNATVQTAYNNGFLGPNGLGGVTVEGMVSGVRMYQDKSGNVFYDFNIMGVSISATVTIVLTNGTNRASANVDPNFSGNDLTLTGNLYPTSMSNIFKGTPVY